MIMELINKLNAGNLFYAIKPSEAKTLDYTFVYDDHFVNDITQEIITIMIREYDRDLDYDYFWTKYAELNKLLEGLSNFKGSSVDLTRRYIIYLRRQIEDLVLNKVSQSPIDPMEASPGDQLPLLDESGEWINRCTVCGVDMGPSNPRQYCRKTYCPAQYEY